MKFLKSPGREAIAAGMFALCTAAGASVDSQALETSNVPGSIKVSEDLGRIDAGKEITLTVRLMLADKAGFDKAVDELTDPDSPKFEHWFSEADFARYAPSADHVQAVRQELENHGLTILAVDPHGYTIRAAGTVANVERVFNTELHQFRHNGKLFRANVTDAHLAGEVGTYVSTVAGIQSSVITPHAVYALNPQTQKPWAPIALSSISAQDLSGLTTTECLSAPQSISLGSSPGPTATYTGNVYGAVGLPCAFLPAQLEAAVGADQVYANGYDGAGQTIVLVEGYGYPTIKEDANALFSLTGLPLLNSKNFEIIYPQGKPADPNLGVQLGWESEIALDVQSAHAIAPGAKIVVLATYGQDSEDFQNSIEYAAKHGLGNSISNSYEEDTDYLAGKLEQTSWDEAIEMATAKGISVNFSTGDRGDNGLGTPLGAPGVPSVAPHATAVGGVSILNDPNNSGAVITTAWGNQMSLLENGTVSDPPPNFGFVSGGGGGESVLFPKPKWQSALPGTGRQTPDVSALADPNTGYAIVMTLGNQQLFLPGIGGTSLACPIFSAFWALANDKAGHPLGQAAPRLARLPYGALTDVLPTSDASANNLTGSITDQNGTTAYSATGIFTVGGGNLYGNTGFISAFYALPPNLAPNVAYDIGFGLDSSLTVSKGWDNATGFGTPYGMAFINAVTK